MITIASIVISLIKQEDYGISWAIVKFKEETYGSKK